MAAARRRSLDASSGGTSRQSGSAIVSRGEGARRSLSPADFNQSGSHVPVVVLHIWRAVLQHAAGSPCASLQTPTSAQHELTLGTYVWPATQSGFFVHIGFMMSLGEKQASSASQHVLLVLVGQQVVPAGQNVSMHTWRHSWVVGWQNEPCGQHWPPQQSAVPSEQAAVSS
jgi:hypothetical protein